LHLHNQQDHQELHASWTRLMTESISIIVGGPGLCSKGVQWLCSSGASFPLWYNGRESYNWLSLRCESSKI